MVDLQGNLSGYRFCFFTFTLICHCNICNSFEIQHCRILTLLESTSCSVMTRISNSYIKANLWLLLCNYISVPHSVVDKLYSPVIFDVTLRLFVNTHIQKGWGAKKIFDRNISKNSKSYITKMRRQGNLQNDSLKKKKIYESQFKHTNCNLCFKFLESIQYSQGIPNV